MASTVVNEVCGSLPLGWELQLCMEQGAAWVELVNPEGGRVELPDAADQSIEAQIREALGVARALAGELNATDSRTRGMEDLLDNVRDILMVADGEQVARAYNQVCTDEVAYQGDSCFSRVGDPEACLTVLDLVDNLTDVLGRTAGVEVARFYNGVCSDQVRYLGDSLFEPLSSTD